VRSATSELLKRGIRPSPQRIKILECLMGSANHPTVDRIYTHLVSDLPTLSKSTIYNTLNRFVASGLVRPVMVDEGETRYDAAVEDHGHFKCESCGTIYDFHVEIDTWESDELAEFDITQRDVYFFGTCSDCLNKRDGAKK